MSLFYLTDKEKAGHLNFLQQQIEANDVDVEMIPWLKEINKLPGVCTTQSCTGHRRDKCQDNGHIRFRLSKPMMNIFLKMLPAIYTYKRMNYVDIRYHPFQKAWDWVSNTDVESFYPEIIIDFLGLDRNPIDLESFLSHLLGILQQCSVCLMEKKRKRIK